MAKRSGKSGAKGPKSKRRPGSGGLARRRAIDAAVDRAQKGRKKKK